MRYSDSNDPHPLTNEVLLSLVPIQQPYSITSAPLNVSSEIVCADRYQKKYTVVKVILGAWIAQSV
jgi:hypothetical protein